MFSETAAYYLPKWRATPQSTSAVIVAFGVILLGGLFAYFLAARAVHRRRARAAADSARDPKRALTLGDTVISGKVALDTEGDAVVVAIEQQGREWQHKGSWHHSWKETRRTVTVQPFYVVRPSGERVRVEPDQRVFLVDRLDGVKANGTTERVRTATLRAGEPVHIVGTLVRGFDPQQGGYRDSGPALVLRPPRSGRMLISTEPLDARFAKRARLHQGLAIAAFFALAVTHGVLFLRHHMLVAFGSTIDAEISDSRSWRVWHKPRRSSGYWVYHYEITANDARLGKLVDEVSSGFYMDVQRGSATRAPFVIAGTSYQVGAASESGTRLGLFTTFALGFALVCCIIAASTLPWYEKKRIVESSGGRLSPDTVKIQ
jgi:hypothetical protein